MPQQAKQSQCKPPPTTRTRTPERRTEEARTHVSTRARRRTATVPTARVPLLRRARAPISMRRASLCVERTTNGGQWLALAAAAGPLRRAQRDEQRGLAARVDDLVLDRSLDRHLARVVAHELVATQTTVTPSRRRRPILICHAIVTGCRRAPPPRRVSTSQTTKKTRDDGESS